MSADVQYTGELKGSDGSTLRIEAAVLVPAAGPTGPTGVTGPTGPSGPSEPPAEPNLVIVGAKSYPLTATNPSSTLFPGGRGTNDLVRYTFPVTLTVTNRWGVEVTVTKDGVVTAVNDRETTGSTTGTPVPAGGYVLSGHGTARTWLLQNAGRGARIQLATASASTGPTGATGPAGGTGGAPVVRTGHLATWWMIWPNSANIRATALPDDFDELRLAFAQGNPISLVGDSPGGLAQMKADLTTLQMQRGKRISLSIGGGGGDAGTGDVTGFITAFRRIEDRLGLQLQGLNFDIESSSFNATQCLRIAQQLRSERGENFRLSWSPNGSNKSDYLAAACDGMADGLIDEFGQQFYDAPVSLSAARNEIDKWLTAGLTAEQCCVGMMVGGGSNYWSVETCMTNMLAIKLAYGIRSAYLWELSRSGTADWASRLRTIVG